MRVLILLLAAAAPLMFVQEASAQARGGSRPAPARGGPSVAAPRAPAAPSRPAAPAAPAAPARPRVPGLGVPGFGAPGFAPGYVIGYYPVPAYGPGYADPYAYAPATPPPPPAAPPDPNAPPPAYYGADPSGQGYPSILVNPNYTPQTAQPLMRDYSYLPPASDAAAQNSAPQVVFLIAMKDHIIYPAIAFWVEKDTLNYITQQGKRTQVPLSQVDRDFSTQLNQERNIDFALPAVTAN